MLGHSALSRPLFAFALVCAAVMSLTMCSDAARASPITAQVDNGVEHKVLRRLYTRYSQLHPPFTGPSPETGAQTGTNDVSEARGDYRDASSITDHQSNPLQFTEGSFSYNQNSPDNTQSREGMTRVQHEVKPASSIFIRYSQRGGQGFETRKSKVNYQPLSQKAPQSGNTHTSYPVIIRKSSHKEAASPSHQNHSTSQVWDPRDAQKSHNEEKVAEDKTVWQPSGSSLFSSRTGRYRSTSLPTPRGHYSDNKETNELAADRPRSAPRAIQSSEFLSSESQTVPRAPSISNGLEASVIKSNPNPEKLTSSITDFSKGLHSASSSETTRYKKFQSYLFRDSQTSFGGHKTVNTVAGDGPRAFSTTPHKQRLSDAQLYGRFSSHFKQLQQWRRKDRSKEVQPLPNNASPLFHNANVAQPGARTDGFTKYQRTAAETLPPVSVRAAPGKDNAMQSFVSIPRAGFQDNYATVRRKSAVSSLVNATTRGSMRTSKPGQTIKRIYGFRGFRNPSVVSSSGSNERLNYQGYRFDNGKYKIPNIYPSKYSFGQRASTSTAAPATVETTPAGHSSPPTSTLGGLVVQTRTTPRPFTSGFTETRPPLPESDGGTDSNSDLKQFRIYRRIYGLKGFATRPHKRAETSFSEPDKSAGVRRGFDTFRSSQQPQSSRIHRIHNKTGETGRQQQNVPNSEDRKALLKTAGSVESVGRFKPDRYKYNRKIYTPPGFRPVQNRTGNAGNKTHGRHKEHNPTTAPASRGVSSAYLGSEVGVESSGPKSQLRALDKTRPVAKTARLLNRFTSSTVRGRRVKVKHADGKKPNQSTSVSSDAGSVAIVRLPKRPAAFKAVTYADILGSASFSGVRATTQAPATPTDEGRFPNTTAATGQREEAGGWISHPEDAAHREGNASRGPGAEEGPISAEGNKLGVRSGEVDRGTKTSDFFLDNEGSGSGGFNMSAWSADATKSQGLSEDLLELDYLRTSTGNTSFKSMKLSSAEK